VQERRLGEVSQPRGAEKGGGLNKRGEDLEGTVVLGLNEKKGGHAGGKGQCRRINANQENEDRVTRVRKTKRQKRRKDGEPDRTNTLLSRDRGQILVNNKRSGRTGESY